MTHRIETNKLQVLYRCVHLETLLHPKQRMKSKHSLYNTGQSILNKNTQTTARAAIFCYDQREVDLDTCRASSDNVLVYGTPTTKSPGSAVHAMYVFF